MAKLFLCSLFFKPYRVFWGYPNLMVQDHSFKEDTMRKLVTRFMKSEKGATAIEYGLIAALIAVVIIGALTALGTSLNTKFEAIVAAL
jgi:pilus assembly protein Flp/PilA